MLHTAEGSFTAELGGVAVAEERRGDEPFVGIDFQGAGSYAKPQG